MSSEFDGVDDAQLEQLAFGRQGRVYDRELAEAALRELARRADARPSPPGRGAPLPGAAQPSDPGTSIPAGSLPLEPDPTENHRRRMRVTGIVAATTAALALVGIAPLITAAPSTGDPLAIFERPASAADAAWATQLTRDYVSGITLGPRTIDLGDGLTAVVFRSAATVDGRSTAFDPFCLWVSEGGSATAPRALSGTCTLPERFAEEGLRIDLRPSPQGGGLDVVTWGPTGTPQLDRNQPASSLSGVRSVLDWLVFPSYLDGDPLAIVDDPERLLMGPSIVPLYGPEGPNSLDHQTWAYLQEGQSVDDPVLCVVTLVTDLTADQLAPLETRTCAPLDAVRRQGLAHTVTSAGTDWEVLIGPDGDGRSDRILPAG
ncbi:MAG: hypothetical protein ACO1N6_02705 [Microcella sp.]